MNSVEVYSVYNIFVLSSYLMEVQVYKYPAHCNKSVDIMNLYNSIICTLGFLYNYSDYALDILRVIHAADCNHPHWSRSCCNVQNGG